ncbi:MAG: sigma-70 family RNA polymerase sigma factor [Clostridiales bacterium]|nr:sigma-70 family RNA polymerase sigma factor [Clostridiales bacterium]
MTEKEIEKIYNEGYRAVYWTAMSLLRNEADAEDVVQDTFVSFIESYGNLEDTSKAVALLKKIAANKSLNRLKSVRTENVDDEVMETIETVPEDFLPDSLVESAEMRRIIMDIIDRTLSEDVRRTIILFYFNEMSTQEIAEALGILQGTVLWRLSYARKKIKKEVEKYEEESNSKLFAMPVPFLTLLFNKEAEQVVIKPVPASLLRLSASSSMQAASVEAGKKIASEAARKGTGIMAKKLLIGLAAVLAVGAVATVVYLTLNHQEDKKEETSKNAIAEITSEENIAESIEGDTQDGIKNASDQTASQKEETTEPTTDATTDETTEDTTNTNTYTKAGKTNPNGTVFVSFDGKTADEVKENLLEIFRTPKDITLDNQDERFMVYPNDRQYKEDAVAWVVYFWDTNSLGYTEGIYQASAHIVRNDDGTLDMGSRISVCFVVKDRERWEELYTASCEALMEMEGINSLMKSGSGDNESSLHMSYFVSKKTDGDGKLLIMVEMPLRDPAEDKEA